MLVGTEKRKKRNSTKVNLLFSAIFHGLILGVALYFAARSGLLGNKIKVIAAEMIKEKPKEPEKPKEAPKSKTEEPKPDVPKPVEVAKIAPPKETIAPPPSTAPPSVAPPVSEPAPFEFDGGKTVVSTADPIQVYKGLLENSLRFNWDRPKDMDDHTNVAEVEVAVDKAGNITNPVWKKSSGQKKWDDSVRLAIADTKSVTHAPPSNFPPRVVIRFDVEPMVPVAQE